MGSAQLTIGRIIEWVEDRIDKCKHEIVVSKPNESDRAPTQRWLDLFVLKARYESVLSGLVLIKQTANRGRLR